MMTQNQINYWNLMETIRANRAKEQENVRHNTVGEDIDYAKNRETKRHNIAQENLSYIERQETLRHNAANEALSSQSIGVSKGNVALGYAQNQLGYAQLGETHRHNKTVERQTQTNNEVLSGIKAYESETGRLGVQYNYAIRQQELNENYQLRQQEIDVSQRRNEISNWDAGARAAGTIINVLGMLLK